MPVWDWTASSMGGRLVNRFLRGAMASAAPSAVVPVVQMLILGLRPRTAVAISPAADIQVDKQDRTGEEGKRLMLGFADGCNHVACCSVHTSQ